MVEVTCSTTLFTVGTFPMVFVVEDTDENKIVTQMIQHGGGCIASSRGPYGICLSSPENLTLLRNEVVFSTEFIKDCCKANRILDINQYRLGGRSSYPDNFNVMKILLRQSHWPAVAERNENDSSNTDKHSDSDTTIESQNSRRNIGSQQRTFSGNEEKAILLYIVENKEIGLILGNTLWKRIAQRKVQGRTWQSLKKHFLKHMLPNITKYTFLSVTDRLEFQKQGDSHGVTNSELKQKSSSSISQRISFHKTAGSGDVGSSSRHVEEHRSNRLPSPFESSASNDGCSLEKNSGRRLPSKRKPIGMSRVHESSDSDSSSHPANTDNQRVQDTSQFNRFTSAQVHRENKDGRHPRKQDDLQHPAKHKARNTQRQQLVINSSNEVDSRNEEPDRSSFVQRTNKGGRQQSVINSSDEVDSGSEQHRRAPVVRRTNSERRKSPDNSTSDDWFMATGRELYHGSNKAINQKPKKLRKRRREEFTMEEEYAIIAYLRKHNRFSNTGGNNVWKNMAATEPVGNRHTWQSLRERYLKKIVPNIKKYNLPEEVVTRIKSKGAQPIAKKAGKYSLFT